MVGHVNDVLHKYHFWSDQAWLRSIFDTFLRTFQSRQDSQTAASPFPGRWSSHLWPQINKHRNQFSPDTHRHGGTRRYPRADCRELALRGQGPVG